MPDTASAKDVLLTEDRGSVRIVRLNRPEKMNALNTPLTQALLDALTAADADENVRALVLCGAGRAGVVKPRNLTPAARTCKAKTDPAPGHTPHGNCASPVPRSSS